MSQQTYKIIFRIYNALMTNKPPPELDKSKIRWEHDLGISIGKKESHLI